MTWEEQAACAGHPDPELWFPKTTTTHVNADPYREARRICAKCPVIAKCAQFAIDNRFKDGMFGGLMPAQREALRKGRPVPDAAKVSTVTRAEENALRYELWEGGAFDADIASARGVLIDTIRSWRREHGLPSNDQKALDQAHILYRSLWNEGLCDREIAARAGVGYKVINNWRRKAGLARHFDPNYARAREMGLASS